MMKMSLRNPGDGKMLAIEDDSLSSPESRFQRISLHLKIFKWFITINVLLLLIFCGYALWSLYQLESALQSRSGHSILDRYEKVGPSSGEPSVAELSDGVVIADFDEWRRSILASLESRSAVDASYNLQFLLRTIANIVENLAGDPRQDGSGTSDGRSRLVTTSLTDFETRVLREFARLTGPENEIGDAKQRYARTTKSVKDESQCNLQFKFSTGESADSKQPIKLVIEPVDIDEGTIKVRNIVNDRTKHRSDVRECSFNIIYKPR